MCLGSAVCGHTLTRQADTAVPLVAQKDRNMSHGTCKLFSSLASIKNKTKSLWVSFATHPRGLGEREESISANAILIARHMCARNWHPAGSRGKKTGWGMSSCGV